MQSLYRAETKEMLIPRLSVAADLRSRMKGLLGTSDLPAEEALWIMKCNSIHTFFMKYAIDCVFLDSKMNVKSVVSEVVPFRMVLPRLTSSTVIEMRAGRAKELGIRKGDKLYVGN